MNFIINLINSLIMSMSMVVMYGWFSGNQFLTKLRPEWVSMKFSTALCFLFTSIMLWFSRKAITHENRKSEILVSASTLFTFFIMFLLLIQNLTGVPLNVENLFIMERENPVWSIASGFPSLMTIISFLLMGLFGLVTIFNTDNFYKRTEIIGKTLLIISSVAFLGYIFNISGLYYYFPEKSTGMALHTAIGFFLTAVNLRFIAKSKGLDKSHEYSMGRSN